MKPQVKFDYIHNLEKQTEEAQEKVFKSNLEEAMTRDYPSIIRSTIDDFLKNKLETAFLDAISEVEEWKIIIL